MNEAITRELQAAGFELIETHISRVFLRGGDVYKTKRAVNLGFLDFSTLAERVRACEAEIELNRRLAPGVYLGLAAVVRSAEGPVFLACEELGDEPVLEWAVHMRRLSDEQRADLLLVRGRLGVEDIERIAQLLARFHRAARADAEVARFGRPDAIAHNVEENFAQVEASIGAYLAPEERAQLASYQRGCLRTLAARFEQRAEAGFVRDGHGDLRLEHLYRDAAGEYVAIDCIEFNERFRFADVCADLAFLVMDLAYHQRADLAELLIASYAEASGDYQLYELLDFYESYRAVVRAKVASILARDQDVAKEVRERAERETRRYYLLAISGGRAMLRPARLIVTFGLIACGKSTLAHALSQRLGCPVLSADRTRKELLALAPTTARHDPAFDGAYTEAFSERVYETLLGRAEPVLRSGRCAILDASFRARASRERVRELASRLGVEVLFLECRCPREVSMERLARRAQGPSVSDGRAEIFDDFAARFESATELAPANHLLLDSAGALEQTLSAALARLSV